VHGGHEFFPLPSPRIKSTYRFFVEAGADAVIAHHTHCISGYEVYRSCPIFYGIGNFLFDYPHPHDEMWTEGLGVRLHLSADAIAFDLIPFVQHRHQAGVHRMVGSEREKCLERIAALNATIDDDDKLAEAFKDFVQLRKKTFLHFLQPYTTHVLHSLYHRGLIPSLLGTRKRQLLLNLVRCESHRDVLMEVLES
jgi:poly-gamma-glutamate synthesis protein (capsule biosynthesis protein)